jgi:ribose-phosphate pyrophosphokinase
MLIACSHGLHIAKNIAKALREDYSELKTRKFPDGELYVKLQKDPKGKHAILVQSFHGDISDCIMEVVFAANTARKLGAKKVTLIAPHFPYHRQDKSFHFGESVSIHSMGTLMDSLLDGIVIMDPHLHRIDSLSKIFRIKAVKASANDTIATYIKKNVKNAAIIGPDWESYKWAEYIGKTIGCEYHILHKKRWSSHKVKIYFRKGVELTGKKVVIIDDIVSSGHTILETIKQLKSIGIKDITVICVHGIFAEGALEKIKKTGATLLSCNTIPSSVSKIDVSKALADAIRNH